MLCQLELAARAVSEPGQPWVALQTPLSRTPLRCWIHLEEVQLSSSLLGLSYSEIDMKVTDKKVHSKLIRILFDAAYHFLASVIIKSYIFLQNRIIK